MSSALSRRRPRFGRPLAPLGVHVRWRRLPRLRRRYAGLGAARQWRSSGWALVQVSPAARNSGRRGRGAERAGRRLARAWQVYAQPARDAGRALRGPRRRSSQNAGRRSAFESGAVNDLLSSLFAPASITRPSWSRMSANWAWRIYEPLIRRAAGLGAAPTRADRRPFRRSLRPLRRRGRRRRPGGPGRRAGGARERRPGDAVRRAARARRLAARRGEAARIDGDSRRPIGSPRRCRRCATRPTSRCCAHADLSAITRRTSSPGSSASADHLAEPDPRLPRERLWQVRAKTRWCWRPARIERPLVFPDNDRPGVMLADAAARLPRSLRRQARHTRSRLTAHDTAYRAALELDEAGVEIALIADCARRRRANGPKRRARRSRVEPGAAIVGTPGACGSPCADRQALGGRLARSRRRRSPAT